jgi:hypothetical protein
VKQQRDIIEKPDHKSVSSYVYNTLDPLFSLYIRLKHANYQGYCQCVTCGAIKHYKEMDCGHFVGRESWGTRFDEMNVGPQCTSCNRYQEGKKAAFALYLMKRYEPDIIAELNERASEICEWTLPDCKKFAKTLRKRIKELAKPEQ